MCETLSTRETQKHEERGPDGDGAEWGRAGRERGGWQGPGHTGQGAGLWHECGWALKPLACSDLPPSSHSEAMEVGKSTCMFAGRYEVVA